MKKFVVKKGDKVLYYDPVKKAKGEGKTLYEWEVTSVFPTHTESGDVACLVRANEELKSGKDRCNVLVNDIEAINSKTKK